MSEMKVETYVGTGHLVDDDKRFEVEYYIRSSECGVSQTIGPASLVSLLQEAATEHAFLLWGRPEGSYPVDPTMRDANLTFVLTRLRLVVSPNPPRWGQRVAIRTWFDAEGKAGARRDWEVLDAETGEVLASATSTWILLDMVKRRLARVPQGTRDFNAPYFFDDVARGRGGAARKVPDAKSGAECATRTVEVAWSDNDANGHVNNARFVRWAVDCIPESPFGQSLSMVEVEFVSEAMFGEALEVCCYEDVVSDGGCTDGEASDFVGVGASRRCLSVLRKRGLSPKKNGKEVARVATEWRSE